MSAQTTTCLTDPAGPPAAPALTGLPSPPSEQEKYWYMGRQHRWLLYVQALSFGAICYSVLKFSVADMRLLVFLIPMSLYVVALLVSLTGTSRAKRTSRAAPHRGKIIARMLAAILVLTLMRRRRAGRES